jgi:hypothetical protein
MEIVVDVLHQDDIKVREVGTLNGEKAIYPHKERLVVRVHNVVDVGVKHFKKSLLLLTLQCLYNELLVMGEEEKAPTFTLRFTCLENVISILNN